MAHLEGGNTECRSMKKFARVSMWGISLPVPPPPSPSPPRPPLDLQRESWKGNSYFGVCAFVVFFWVVLRWICTRWTMFLCVFFVLGCNRLFILKSEPDVYIKCAREAGARWWVLLAEGKSESRTANHFSFRFSGCLYCVDNFWMEMTLLYNDWI